MEFQVLGPLQVIHDGQPVYFANAPKPRLLLAILLAHADRPLSVDRLVDALWNGRPPSSARQNLHQYIHRLRLSLGQSLIQRDPSGYRLSGEINLDSQRFLKLAQSGTAAFEQRRFGSAAQELATGLKLWRGEAFEGLADCELIRPTAVRLEQAAIDAAERWAASMLGNGQAREVLPSLAKYVERYPLDERLRAHMMRALADNGRQSEALQLYRDTRKMLIEQLGVEPGLVLQQAHEAVLRTAGEPHGPLVVPRELPANVGGFVGRQEELNELDLMLPSDPEAVVISAIAGTAGVGKTALAIRWAHQVAEHFPDGQLYLNLNGFSSQDPVTPLGALSSLLRSLGMQPREIPAEVSAAAARYRTLLSGRRMLIVLDNVRSVGQVRPLLPGGRGCLVLVTSRDRLSGLVAAEGARRLNLGTLRPAESIALLERLVGRDRIDADPDTVEELVKLCAFLPLALRIAAARLADQPNLSIHDYVAALRKQNPTLALATDDGAVRTAFQHSYESLNPLAQRVFRRLGLLPLQDFTPASVAQLADLSENTAGQLLDQLASAHLVSLEPSGRFTLHDLLRHYASLVSGDDTEPDRDAAVDRLYRWYLVSTHAAADQYYPHVVRLPLPKDCATAGMSFSEPKSAAAWLNLERRNLALLTLHAGRRKQGRMAWLLGDALRGYHEQMPFSTDSIDMARAAVAAARAGQNHMGLAAAFQTLAHACYGLARYRSCEQYLAIAARYSASAGWARGRACILANLGMMFLITGRSAEGIALAEGSVAAYEAIGDLAGIAKSRDLLANCFRDVGRLREGIDQAQIVLELYSGLGSELGRSQAFEDLGALHHDLGNSTEAIERLNQALKIAMEMLVPRRIAAIQIVLAHALLQAGDQPAARKAAEAVIEMADELRDARLQLRALILLGSVQEAEGDHRRAFELFGRALEKVLMIRADHQLADAHLGLARTSLAVGMDAGAAQHAQTALDVSRVAGFRVQEARALDLLAHVRHRAGDGPAALELARQALDLHTQTGHRPGEIRSRELLEEIARASGSS